MERPKQAIPGGLRNRAAVPILNPAVDDDPRDGEQ